MSDLPDRPPVSRTRALRRDASANRERILQAAVTAIRREGHKVPLHDIAAEAGVGPATLYRSFPDRRALLLALAGRAYDLIIEQLEMALERDESALKSLDQFLDWQIEHRDELILPLHGGPINLDEESNAKRRRISETLTAIVRKGQQEGLIRDGITSIDVVIFSALLTQPLPNAPSWDVLAHRQKTLFLDGLTASERKMPSGSPTMEDIQDNFLQKD
ncbi:TetR/AcrR family transcriptional regulator [Streptomyces bauhiniae]|uniref:TetR/AcrR family transcriptional regulator n=1 Tax=Streptomyces bauhiniae TaxID=2340725 RepID=UPI00364A0430